MKTTVYIKFDTRDPDLGRLREVARGCREGKIAAFPTETTYGIGGSMSVPGISQTLAEIKRREPGKPFSFHIGEMEMLGLLGIERTPVFRYLSRLFWPGPLTLLVKNQQGETVGLRFPRNRLATALINASGEPFIATSANISGRPSVFTADEVMQQLGGLIDYVIDGGRTEYANDSTIVDLSGPSPSLVRAGAEAEPIERVIEKIKLGKFPRRRILLVCTGNSCRSPMAAGWLTSELRRKGLADEIEVSSCGIGARAGAPATAEAVLVMKNREVDISSHRSRPCTRDDVLNADLIYAMSQEHYHFLIGMVPEAREKIKVLDIPDPIGMGMMIYEQVIAGIEKKLKAEWEKICE